MDLDTVGGLVNELLSAYDAALEYYTKWQRRKWQENHYRTHDKGKLSGSGSCGLSTSLSISGPIIRKAYNEAAETLGERFSIGDKTCREVLHRNLRLFQEHIGTLYEAMTRDNGPLQLAEILQASEAVRISTITTLAGQCKRLSVSRPTSLVAPTAASSSSSRRRVLSMNMSAIAATTTTTTSDRSSTKKGGIVIEEDMRSTRTSTVYPRNSGSNRSPFQSEPPSPPPTPPKPKSKLIPDDLNSNLDLDRQSTYTATSAAPRPTASVFSVFCPEAMKYQVDVRKAMPAAAQSGRCRCGYDWYGWLTGDDSNAAGNLVVKDGFVLTPRFLGKSHCRGGVFGCVLCTSTGKTETYADAEALREHINAAHSKWQMLHDSDMAGRLGVAGIP